MTDDEYMIIRKVLLQFEEPITFYPISLNTSNDDLSLVNEMLNPKNNIDLGSLENLQICLLFYFLLRLRSFFFLRSLSLLLFT